MDKLIIIDGNSLVNRAFYALPPMLSGGKPTNAVYGFVTMLVRMIQKYSPTHIAVAFDRPEPTFRHRRYDGYKATRKGMPDDLACQMQPLKDLLKGMGIKTLEFAGYEADDVIGTLSKRFSVATYIVTGDRDAFQLIDDTTTVVLTKRGITEVAEFDAAALKKEYGFFPNRVVDYKAIAGDDSDNIPGVKGIGEKGAKQLLEKYDGLEEIYKNLSSLSPSLALKLSEQRELAFLSKELAAIDTAAPIECDEAEMKLKFPFDPYVKTLFLSLGFKSLAARADLFSSDESDFEAVKKEKAKRTIVEISELSRLKSVLAENVGKPLAFDTDGETANFAFDEETEYTVKLLTRLDFASVGDIDFMATFAPVFSDKTVEKTVYDAKKLMSTLSAYRIDFAGFWDVKIARYVCDYTLKNDSLKDVFDEKGEDFSSRACSLFAMRVELGKRIEENGLSKVFYDIELPLVSVLYDMERAGFKLDLKRLDELNGYFLGEISRLTGEIYSLSGTEFNINSPKQLAKVLFEDMKIPYPKKGSISTSAEVLQQLVDYSPVIEKILDYRTVSKLNSTFVEGLRAVSDSSGVVHTEFRQTVTATGRLSSVEPNLQNIPIRTDMGRQLRSIFVARDNCTLVSADYSQIELRLLAAFSGDEILAKAYRSGEDVHAYTAAKVFGVSREKVTDGMRRMAKAVNFGIIYGISDYGLAQGINMTRYEAKKYIDEYFRSFPSVKGYLNELVEKAKKDGYATTLMGRRRKIPELRSAQYVTRQFGERVAMNMPLQGSAADIIKLAMTAVRDRLRGKKSRLILQVHDELIVEAADDETEEVKKILTECMENAVSLSVPLTVEVGVGKSWMDC